MWIDILVAASFPNGRHPSCRLGKPPRSGERSLSSAANLSAHRPTSSFSTLQSKLPQSPVRHRVHFFDPPAPAKRSSPILTRVGQENWHPRARPAYFRRPPAARDRAGRRALVTCPGAARVLFFFYYSIESAERPPRVSPVYRRRSPAFAVVGADVLVTKFVT